MSDPELTLQYDISADEIGALMKRAASGAWSEWARKLIALLLLCFAVSAWRNQHYWVCGFGVFASVFMATPRVVLVWWLLRSSIKKHCPVRVRVQNDGIGLHYPNAPEQTPQVFKWSRLSCIRGVGNGFEVTFDSDPYPLITVPDHAFADEGQRETFRAMISEHIRK